MRSDRTSALPQSLIPVLAGLAAIPIVASMRTAREPAREPEGYVEVQLDARRARLAGLVSGGRDRRGVRPCGARPGPADEHADAVRPSRGSIALAVIVADARRSCRRRFPSSIRSARGSSRWISSSSNISRSQPPWTPNSSPGHLFCEQDRSGTWPTSSRSTRCSTLATTPPSSSPRSHAWARSTTSSRTSS